MHVHKTYRNLCILKPSLIFNRDVSSRSFQTLPSSKPTKSISTNSTKTSRFLVLCNTQITKNGRNGNLQEAESIFNRMPIKSVVSWTAMLTAYAENGETFKARKLFDEMPQRNIATWNAMITAYIRDGVQINEALELFYCMPERNPVSYAVMITGFVRSGMLHEAEKVYSKMPRVGRDPVASNALISGYLKRDELEDAVRVFEGMVERNVVSWSSILDGYCKKGRIDEAKEIFEKMPERNVVSWTAMVSGFLKMGYWEDGFILFMQMRREENVQVNSTTLTVIFEACTNMGRFKEGIQIHGLVISMGFGFDVILGNSIINMYCRGGSMIAARTMFDVIDKKDVVSWNSVIAGYVQNNSIEEAFTLFNKMPGRDIVSWTTMIAGLLDQGRIEESICLFNEMPKKDDVAWTAIISGLVANEKYEEAFRWYILMLRDAIKPNSVTLSSILGASSGLATLNQGVQIHANIVKMEMETDLFIQNSLISMYGKCGNVGDAFQVFTSIHSPNVVSMNSMITTYAHNGFGKESLELFKKMQLEGLEPNQVTFLGVLSACVHMGLVGVGWGYFNSMSSTYHIEPRPDHYACMVDLLGRAGLLKEALDLIQSMPIEPHPGVWGALLSASRTHMNVDIAKLAARHLFLIEPENATTYTVLSNVYSIAGLEKDVQELRMVKKTKGVKKNPGCSWIIVNNKVNLFLVSDQSHKEFEEINAMLRRLATEMREFDCH